MPEKTTPTVGTATKQRPSPFSPRAILTVLAIAIVLQLGINWLWPSSKKTEGPSGVHVTMSSAKVTLGNPVEVTLANDTDQPLSVADACPNSPLYVERKEGESWVPQFARTENATCPAFPQPIPARASVTIKYSPWNEALFPVAGRYRISVPKQGGDFIGVLPDTSTSVEFDVAERGWFSQAIVTSLYQPLYNALIWIITLFPGMQLGLAIIVLTILVRLLLFVPTYHSLSNQAELQALQPELQRIQKEFADDKEKQVQATMKLYSDRGVNPLGSCLPLLIQLPVLWAMYYVLAGGMDPTNHALLYQPLQHVQIGDIITHFLGLDLLATGAWQLALVVGALQFLSMKLITWTLPPEARNAKNPAAGVNSAMTYLLPLMVGYFAYAYQAGLGLYWATSTLFGIGQQLVLKRAKDRQSASRAARDATKNAGAEGTKEIQDAEFREIGEK